MSNLPELVRLQKNIPGDLPIHLVYHPLSISTVTLQQAATAGILRLSSPRFASTYCLLLFHGQESGISAWENSSLMYQLFPAVFSHRAA